MKRVIIHGRQALHSEQEELQRTAKEDRRLILNGAPGLKSTTFQAMLGDLRRESFILTQAAIAIGSTLTKRTSHSIRTW